MEISRCMNRKKPATTAARYRNPSAPISLAPVPMNDGVCATRFLQQAPQPRRAVRAMRFVLPAFLVVPVFGGALLMAPTAKAATSGAPASTRAEKSAAATVAKATAVRASSEKTLISGVRLAQAQTNTPAAAPEEPQKEPGAIVTVDPAETKPPEAPAPCAAERSRRNGACRARRSGDSAGAG